jgi:hypothetical protein
MLRVSLQSASFVKAVQSPSFARHVTNQFLFYLYKNSTKGASQFTWLEKNKIKKNYSKEYLPEYV